MCPFCGGEKPYWRSGVGFEHEMVCPECWFTYQPDNVQEFEILDRRKYLERRIRLHNSSPKKNRLYDEVKILTAHYKKFKIRKKIKVRA